MSDKNIFYESLIYFREVDYDKIDEYVDFLVDNGVKNIFRKLTHII